MDIRRSVTQFVTHGKGLFQQLRSDGEALSDVDLVTLREQLHILDTEAGHLQDLKEFRSEISSFIFADKQSSSVKQPRGKNHG